MSLGVYASEFGIPSTNTSLALLVSASVNIKPACTANRTREVDKAGKQATVHEMLSEENIQAIEEDEMVRQKVRLQFSKQTRVGKLWELLNSSFFLWCLSTIVVGLLSFFYQEWSIEREKHAATQETVRKLDTEISSRLRFLYISLRSGQHERFVFSLNQGSEERGVFPEYENRSLRALLWELSNAVPKSEKAEIEKALNVSRAFLILSFHEMTGGKLVEYYLFPDKLPLQELSKRLQSPKDLDEIGCFLDLLYLIKTLNLERWGSQFGNNNKLSSDILEFKKRVPKQAVVQPGKVFE